MSDSKETFQVVVGAIALLIPIIGIIALILYFNDLKFQYFVREIPIYEMLSNRLHFIIWALLTFGLPTWILLSSGALDLFLKRVSKRGGKLK